MVLGLILSFAGTRLRASMPSVDSPPRQGSTEKRPIAAICEGTSVTQEFPARADRIDGVQIRLATYARVNRGNVYLQVRRKVGDAWETIARRTVAKRKLVDNAYHLFGFAPRLPVTTGQPISLTISADHDCENAITWWMSPGERPPGHKLTVNGVVQDGTAHFDVDYPPLKGRAGGPRLRGRLWKRLTVFLDPLGQLMLAGGFVVAVLALIHLLLWPDTQAQTPMHQDRRRDPSREST